MLTLWRYPVNTSSSIKLKNKELYVCNFGKLIFCDCDRHQKGHTLGCSRNGVMVDAWTLSLVREISQQQ